jgi:uncharacterized C2H2 Zn-finger protein
LLIVKGTNTYALEVHIRSLHEGILDFKCLYCDKGFRLAYPCQRHESKCRMRPHSPRITENGKSHDGENGESTENDVKCPQCDQTFSNQLALNAHCKLLHDGHNEMVLMALNDVRKSRGNRKRHDSGAEFGSNGEEMKKMRKSQGITFTNVVTGETYCGLCGLTTKNVHEHTQEKHTNNPPRFYCNVCDKSYTQKAHLKKHCMINHCYNSEEFNAEYPRPGLQSIPKTDYVKSNPVRIGRPPLERNHHSTPAATPTHGHKNHPTKIPKKHSVTFEDLFVLKKRFNNDETDLKVDIECQVCGTNFDNQADFTSHVQKKHRAKFRRSMENPISAQRPRVQVRERKSPISR